MWNIIFSKMLYLYHENWYHFLENDDFVIHCHTKNCHGLAWRFSHLQDYYKEKCINCGMGHPLNKKLSKGVLYPYNGRVCSKCLRVYCIECVDTYELDTSLCGLCNDIL